MAFLIPECHVEKAFCVRVWALNKAFIDKSLVLTVGKTDGFGTVFNKLEEHKHPPVVGLIDYHNLSLADLKRTCYYDYKQTESDWGVLVKRLPKTHQYLVEIDGFFENWLIEHVPANIFEDRSIPRDPVALKKLTEKPTIVTDVNFVNFLDQAIPKTAALKYLQQQLLQHFK